MPALLQIEDKNIEFILGTVAQLNEKAFGKIKEELKKTTAYTPTSDDRVAAYFELTNRREYTLVVESKDGSLDPENGKASIKIQYHSKSPVRLTKTPENLQRPTTSLGGILYNAAFYRLGIDYVSDSLQKLGFKWVNGAGRNRTYEAEAQIGKYKASITVDLRETPDNPKHPQNWDLNISIRVNPHANQPEKPKPTKQYCQGLLATINP